MTRSVKLEPLAESDLMEAVLWYEDHRPGLGDEFLASVEDAFDRIARNPLAYTEVDPGLRRALVKRFPFGAFYVAASSPIVVIAVFHCFRDPDEWRSRI